MSDYLRKLTQPNYAAPSAAVQAVSNPGPVVGRGEIKPEPVAWRNVLSDFLREKFGNRTARRLMTAADLTPAGAVFMGNEARLNYDKGNRGAAAAGIALAGLPLPGAGRVAKKVAQEAAPAVERGITAYHGSPHSFDRFSLDKIGTGEGAQAYGHGLYFAENEDVANSYRQALAKVDRKPFEDAGLRDRDVDAAFSFAKTGHFSDPQAMAKDFANWTGKPVTPELVEAFKQAKDPGSMYQVRIDADPADFLDYDAPLSGQPQRVREGVARAMSRGDETLGNLFGDLSDPNAMQLAGLFPKSSGAQVYNTITASDRAAATQALREAGIPGIKYLDQGSRSNAFKVQLTYKGQPYGEPIQAADRSHAENLAKEYAEKGFGTELVDQGSRNYVVFDDKLISILKKYGWVPGMAIPAAAYEDVMGQGYNPQTGEPI